MKSIQTLMNMEGRVSLITGGSGFVGRAMAEALAEIGSDLVLLDLASDRTAGLAAQLAERHGIRVQIVNCDLEREDEVVRVPEQVVETVGRLDVLVNNAGFVGTSGLNGWVTDFGNQSSTAWRRALEVNLTAAFELSQGCRRLLDASGNGSIINVASIYGVYGPDLSLYAGTEMNSPAAYAVSKGGLLQMTRWLATVLSPGIRVNAISPGGIARDQPEVFVERYVARTPLKRMGTEEDFKGVVAFLASDMSRWVTGENIMVDGGWGAW